MTSEISRRKRLSTKWCSRSVMYDSLSIYVSIVSVAHFAQAFSLLVLCYLEVMYVAQIAHLAQAPSLPVLHRLSEGLSVDQPAQASSCWSSIANVRGHPITRLCRRLPANVGYLSSLLPPPTSLRRRLTTRWSWQDITCLYKRLVLAGVLFLYTCL
jgi:hypothetical protein